MTDVVWSRVVLVGLMGAGKSTVGPRLANALGWDFVDVDAELVRRSGVSVADWFARRGEPAFRAEEARLTAELSSRDRLVLAPGGGWAAQPGSLESLPRGTAVIWLRLSAEEAVRRARQGGAVRPLLAGADPVGTLRALLQEREQRYEQAHYVVDAERRTPDESTRDIVAWLKTNIS